jgi:8-oxo-dGTP diphosphatase
MPYTYEYPRPAVTVDVVIFTIRAGELALLMIRRGGTPFKGHWALPGGFVEENETLERAAARELQEETGIVQTSLVQLGAFGDPGRDPRGHTVSVAFYAFIAAPARPVAADDAADAQWVSLHTIARTRVAFDHARIIALASQRLRDQLGGESAGASFARIDLVPPRFTLSELQHVHEAVLGRQIDKRNFRAKLLAQELVEPVTSAHRTGRHRPAQLYRWTQKSGLASAPSAAPPARTRAPVARKKTKKRGS